MHTDFDGVAYHAKTIGARNGSAYQADSTFRRPVAGWIIAVRVIRDALATTCAIAIICAVLSLLAVAPRFA